MPTIPGKERTIEPVASTGRLGYVLLEYDS